MAAEDIRAVKLLQKYSKMDVDRASWRDQWQAIKELVRVNAQNFYGRDPKGYQQVNLIYDGTAPWALEQLASALHNYCTSPTSRWFNIVMDDDFPVSDEELAWLEAVSDLLYKEYANPKVNFAPMMHEIYLDLPAMGTAVLYQSFNLKTGHLSFRTFPLADCKIKEDSNGIVDTVFRDIVWQSRQVDQEFSKLPPILNDRVKRDEKGMKEFRIVHAVFPRSDRDARKFTKTNKPWASMWISYETKEVIDEGGYDIFPYHIPRWSKLAGETYGRSPAMTCLPDIKMLNQMSKTIIKGAQKVIDPPLMVPDDGFVMPLKTNPGSLMIYEPGTEAIVPLETKGKIHIGLDMEEQRRSHIIKCFYVDWIIRPKKRERQTTTEIMDDRNEMLRQMAPMLGRLHGELISPLIRRSFYLLARYGRIPPPPESVMQRGLNIEFVSPAAKAQRMEKALSIQQFTEGLVTLSQINPEVVDNVDTDAVASEMAVLGDVPRKIIRDEEELAAIRQQRRQQQEQERQTMLAKEGAGAVRDLAAANEMGGVM